MAVRLIFLGILGISVVYIPTVLSSNILLYPLIGEGSHYQVMLHVAEELINRGHNVTMLLQDIYLTGVDDKGVGAKLNFLFSKSTISKEEHHATYSNLTNACLRGEYTKYAMEISKTDFFERTNMQCRLIFENDELMSNIANSNFALSVTDNNHQCPLVQYLRKKYGVPFVSISAISSLPSLNLLEVRSPFNPSYMPELASGLDHVMTFKDRLKNTGTCIISILVFSMLSNPFTSLKKDFGIGETGSFYEDAELLLMNSNFAVDFPRPILPNVIAVGGLTTGPAKPLSHEWLEFLDSAGEDGVVLFSMGSYASGIDDDVAALFAGAFAQIHQKVIWKLNGKPSASLSANVKVVDWVPQNDLLAHPQVKVFVSHSGVNSVWEAVYHGVPVVALPFFGEQFDNAQRIVSEGMAVKVDVTTLTSDELANAIRTIANVQSFKKNAKRVSSIFRDTTRTPAETAVDWIEYVIRHGGASHLRSAALDLNIFQYLLLDAAAVILLSCIIIVAIVFLSCKLCFKGCRRLCGFNSSTDKMKTE